MQPIPMHDIDYYSLFDITSYLFSMPRKASEIVEKKIRDVDLYDLLYLVRREICLEVSVMLILREIEIKGYSGHSYNLDDYSLCRNDVVKEMLLLEDEFWQMNQESYRRLLYLWNRHDMASGIRLPAYIINHFLNLQLGPVVWTEEDIKRILTLLEIEVASTVHGAFDRIRRLKRAVGQRTPVRFNDGRQMIPIIDRGDIIEVIIQRLPAMYREDLIRVIDKEVPLILD